MQWASAISRDEDARTAFAAAAQGIETDLGAAPDLVAMFVSPHHRDAYGELSRLVRERFGDALLVGCSAGGVIGRGSEVEHAPALSLTAGVLPDVKLRPLRFDGMPPRAEDWPERLQVAPDLAPAFVLFADPFSADAEGLVRGLDLAFPGAVKIGGLASGADEPGGNALFLGEETFSGGAIGVALWGDITVDGVVAQGCRPIGEPLIVTRCDRNVLQEVDRGRPLEVLQRMFASLSAQDQALARTSLFLGVEMKDKREVYGQGDFLIRNLVGSDPKSGAIAVGALLEPYTVVQFHLRDARTSATDLHARLRDYAAVEGRPPAAGALLFSCLGRGQHLYDEPDHDSRAFGEHLGEVPLGGFFCNGEIGPVGGTTFLHGYTSAFALFRPRRGATRH